MGRTAHIRKGLWLGLLQAILEIAVLARQFTRECAKCHPFGRRCLAKEVRSIIDLAQWAKVRREHRDAVRLVVIRSERT
jgi:hypothetical protein